MGTRVVTFWGNMKIRTKIMLMYVLILCFSMGISALVFKVINDDYVEGQIGEATVQTVDALKGNLSIIFENVEQFSNMIYFDDNVQTALASTDSLAIDPTINQTVQKSLVNMLLSANYIESVYVFDRYFNSYSSKKIAPIRVDTMELENTGWYQRADEGNGATIYIYDTEGVFSYPTRPEHRGISLVRAINSETDYARLALLVVNINESTIIRFFEDVGAEYGAKYCIVDGKDAFVVSPSDMPEELWDETREVLSETGRDAEYSISGIGGESYCIVRRDLGIEDWSIVGMVPMNNNLPNGSFQRTLVVLFVALNIVVAVLCSLSLFRLIFRPLSQIGEYMAAVEHAEFKEIPTEECGNNEIIQLKRGFNSMVNAIEGLLEKVKQEEQTLARNEFEILQAQINPHFLYNTLDAISALALTGQQESCFRMTQALGQFYRNSLNSGRQIVTVQDEIDCVKNYVTILNIRYDNKINLECEIQDEIFEWKMLKLVLQPVVENAVHHGIRNREGDGTIRIVGYSCDEELILSVADDGVGMTEEKQQEILSGKSQKGKSGFGLYSEIQRISLFYGIKNPITIISEPDGGTEITICLKKLQGEKE
jgi:two-component system sensor histidine kinase YesM